MLLKIINIFKNKTELLGLLNTQDRKIQELDDRIEALLKLGRDSNSLSKSFSRLNNKAIALNKELLYKVEKLEKEKVFIKQELKSLLENN